MWHALARGTTASGSPRQESTAGAPLAARKRLYPKSYGGEKWCDSRRLLRRGFRTGADAQMGQIAQHLLLVGTHSLQEIRIVQPGLAIGIAQPIQRAQMPLDDGPALGRKLLPARQKQYFARTPAAPASFAPRRLGGPEWPAAVRETDCSTSRGSGGSVAGATPANSGTAGYCARSALVARAACPARARSILAAGPSCRARPESGWRARAAAALTRAAPGAARRAARAASARPARAVTATEPAQQESRQRELCSEFELSSHFSQVFDCRVYI